jgi:hypothetical protein
LSAGESLDLTSPTILKTMWQGYLDESWLSGTSFDITDVKITDVQGRMQGALNEIKALDIFETDDFANIAANISGPSES